MEITIGQVIGVVALAVELCSASILLYGFIRVFKKFWQIEYKRLRGDQDQYGGWKHLKPEIGSYILLGLDFYIISDILNSMVAEDNESLIRLGVVVFLRTLIGYFLGKEVESSKQPKDLKFKGQHQ